MAKDSSHGHYVTLLRVTNANASAIDRAAQEIHEAFMAEFGEIGAFTAGLFELLRGVKEGTNAATPGQWTHVIRYFGPVQSVAWLQKRLEDVAKSINATVTTETFTVRDITGKY